MMMKLALVVIICCLVCSAVPAAAPIRAANTSAFERSTTATITAPRPIKVTRTSAPGSRALGVLQPGDRVLVEGRDDKGSWLYVDSTVGAGYLAALAVAVDSSLDAVPTVAGDLPVPTL